jgi:YVTN family beta-propeller protein
MKATFTPGATFAGYRVVSLVGRGGMGVVYRATDLSLERPVALKLIAPELAEDERFRARFLREPRLAASLDHPNVVPIYEAGEHEGQLYLAMRFVEGSDLKSVLEREGRLPPERALAVLAQVAGALDAAHKRALVHRDVKPANVLLDEEGHAYMTDFGITKQVGGASTDTGRVVGTLDYLAPEQIRGEPVDGRTDCYALACVLYECLAGAPPFRRATEAETLWAHMQGEPAPLPAHRGLDPVLRKALAKEQDDRYATCGALIDAAADALGLGQAPRARRPSVLRRRGRVLLGAGLVLLAVAIAAAILSLTALVAGGASDTIAVRPNSVAVIDPGENRVVDTIRVDENPGPVALGAGILWVLNLDSETVSRIDPRSRRLVATQGIGRAASNLAASPEEVWVLAECFSGGRGLLIHLYTARSGGVDLTEEYPLGPAGDDAEPRALQFATVAGCGLAAAGRSAWVTPSVSPGLARFDYDPAVEGSRRVWSLPLPRAPVAVAVGYESVWAVDPERDLVRQVDADSGEVLRSVRAGKNPVAVATGADSVWVANSGDGSVSRIDPRTDVVRRSISVGESPAAVAVGAGSVWVANGADGTVSRIDPRTDEVIETIPVGHRPQGIAVAGGAVWTTVRR